MKTVILLIILAVVLSGLILLFTKRGKSTNPHSSGRTEDPTNWRKKRDKDKLPTN